jgi:hypothetical protein
MPNATHRAVLAYLEASLMAEEALAQSQALNYAHAPLQPNTRATSIDRTPDNPYVPLNFNSNALGLDWMDFQDDFDRPDFY